MKAIFVSKDEKVDINYKKDKLKTIIEFYMKKFIIKEINSEYFKEKIVKGVKEYVKISGAYNPRYIIVSGQYLGSYVRGKLLGERSSKVIKNDIDIFVPYYSVMNTNDELREDLIIQPYISGFDIYQPYRVYRSDKFDLISVYNTPINIVLVEHPVFSRYYQDKDINSRKLLHLSKNIIESFDVNSVRLGIIYDLKEDKFDYYISDTYIDFILSGNITILSDTNWFKSFPRVLKKVQEFALTDNVIKFLKSISDEMLKNRKSSVCYIYNEDTLEHIDNISISQLVYTDLNKLIRYYDLLISGVKYFNELSELNRRIEIDVVREKKLTEMFSKFFINYLNQLGYKVRVSIDKDKESDASFITPQDQLSNKIKIIIDKDLDYNEILDNTFILKEFIDLSWNLSKSLNIKTIFMLAKIEVLIDSISKKKLEKINEYLKSISVGDLFRLGLLVNIVRSNATNISLGDLKIFKLVSNHDEIISVYNSLIQVLKFPQVVEILNYFESIRREKIDQITDKAVKKLAVSESIKRYYDEISLRLYNHLIEVYENFDNYKELFKDLGQVIDKIIENITSLKNESLLVEGFVPIEITIDNKYKIQELITSYDLRYEGVVMKHCVGGYDYSVKNGNSCIFKIECSDDDSFRYTCEINPRKYEVVQCRGVLNKPVDDNHKEIVDKLIEKTINEMKKQRRNEIVEEYVENKPSICDINFDRMQQVDIF